VQREQPLGEKCVVIEKPVELGFPVAAIAFGGVGSAGAIEAAVAQAMVLQQKLRRAPRRFEIARLLEHLAGNKPSRGSSARSSS
jgi:hypothetical protein